MPSSTAQVGKHGPVRIYDLASLLRLSPTAPTSGPIHQSHEMRWTGFSCCGSSHSGSTNHPPAVTSSRAATHSWYSNFGQFQRNTVTRLVHRLARGVLAVVVVLITRLIEFVNLDWPHCAHTPNSSTGATTGASDSA